MGWPGLSADVGEICKSIGMENINKVVVGKKEIQEAIFYHNNKEIKIEMQKYKKIEDTG